MINNLMYIELKKVYPRPKQVKPKLTTAIKSTILMAYPSFPVDSLSSFYVIRGSQVSVSLRSLQNECHWHSATLY